MFSSFGEKTNELVKLTRKKKNNIDCLNIAVATEPSTSAQEPIPNPEVVADKRDEINIEYELHIENLLEDFNLLKGNFQLNKDRPNFMSKAQKQESFKLTGWITTLD